MGRRYTADDMPLTMVQIMADIITSENIISEAESKGGRLGKYLKGLAGYHLQQASEKLIKIQIYHSNAEIDNSKIYKHKLYELIGYANSLGINIIVPQYINKNAITISSWEAEGRYDIHVVVRVDTLKICLQQVKDWYDEVKKLGIK